MMDKIKDNPSYSAIREQLKGANAFRKALKVLSFAGIKNKELNNKEKEYILNLLMTWIQKELRNNTN